MIAVCGEALIDFTPADIDGTPAYVRRFGGSPRNVAVGLARLGTPTAFVGRASRDAFGGAICADLAREGVSLRWTARGDEPTALAFVSHAPDGTHDFAFYGANVAADQNMRLSDLPQTFPDDVNAMHFGSYSLVLGGGARTYEALMRRERGRRVISLDPNVRPALYPDRAAYARRIESLIRYATIVKASSDDLAWLYPDERPRDVALRWLAASEYGAPPPLVIVTLGADGAIAFTAGAELRGAGVPVAAVADAAGPADAVGAGDAFTAALLSRLDRRGVLTRQGVAELSANALCDALAHSNAAAALACAKPGADPPTRAELECALRRAETALDAVC